MDTHNRHLFYIHGGKKPASGFGISLTDKIEAFLSAFKQAGRDLVLVVRGTAPQIIAVDKGQRDFAAFCAAVGARESSNNYQAVNSSGYMGRYQFGMGRLMDLTDMVSRSDPSGHGQKNSDFKWNTGYSQKKFLDDTALQDKVFKSHCSDLSKRIQKNYGTFLGQKKKLKEQYYSKYLKKNVGEVTITLSGLVGAAHLVGYERLSAFLNNNVDDIDGNQTHMSEYVDIFCDYTLIEAIK